MMIKLTMKENTVTKWYQQPSAYEFGVLPCKAVKTSFRYPSHEEATLHVFAHVGVRVGFGFAWKVQDSNQVYQLSFYTFCIEGNQEI